MDTLRALASRAQQAPSILLKLYRPEILGFDPVDPISKTSASAKILAALLTLSALFSAALLILITVDWWVPEAHVTAPLIISLGLSTAVSLMLWSPLPAADLNKLLRLFCAVPALGLWAIYTTGYMALSLAPIITFICVVAWRREWSLGLILLSVLMMGFAESLSQIQAADKYVLRLLVTSAALIWPLRTLLAYQTWNDKVRFEALTHLLWSAFAALALIATLAATAQQVAHISLALLIILFFGWIFKARQHYVTVWVARLFAGCISIVYFSTLSSSGFQATMVLPLMTLLFYLVLHRSEAALMSSIIFVLGVNEYFDTFNTEFAMTPLFAGWAITNLLFIGAMHFIGILFEMKEQSDQPKLSYLNSVLIVALSALISGVTFWIGHFGLSTPITLANLLSESPEQILINSIIWLTSTWVVSSFAVNFLNLRKSETALKHAFESERSAVKELEAANTELNQRRIKQEQLFSIIGHELRTPLTSIKMLQEDMELNKLDPRGDELCRTTDTVLSILDDLRVVIRPEEAAKAKLTVDSPFEIIERSVNSLSSLAFASGLRIHVRASTEQSEHFKFNAQALRQITTNLLKNAALHANATNAWITLDSSRKASGLVEFTLCVEDDGRGIHGAKRDALFEAFTRGNTDADGTGLGLYISQQLANNLGGEISFFDSKYGGAGFKLKFVLTSQQSSNSEISDAPVEACLEGLRILFAEDQATIRMLTTKQLEKQGAKVVAAEDGLLALEHFEPDAFDLIITDINMPNMNGYGLTEALRERGYRGCIMGLTAAVIGEETDRLLGVGANFVLAKPLDLTKLKQTLWIAQKNPLK